MNEALNTNTLISQLLKGDVPLSDEQHDAFLTTDRQLYATLLRLPTLLPETAIAIIQRLLAVTETKPGTSVSESQRLQEDKLIVKILAHLPVANVLAGFLELVERHVNNQRTSGWIRAYIFGSPQLESWAVSHRRALRKLIRHALGNPVTLTCLHQFAEQEQDDKTTNYLRRCLNFFVRSPSFSLALQRDSSTMKLDIWKSSEKPGHSLTSLADLLQGRESGASERWGHLEMIPLFGTPSAAGAFAPPETSLRLTQVTNYGEMVLENQGKLPTVVPLNLGYFQNSAQNHAMCVSALLDADESRQFH